MEFEFRLRKESFFDFFTSFAIDTLLTDGKESARAKRHRPLDWEPYPHMWCCNRRHGPLVLWITIGIIFIGKKTTNIKQKINSLILKNPQPFATIKTETKKMDQNDMIQIQCRPFFPLIFVRLSILFPTLSLQWPTTKKPCGQKKISNSRLSPPAPLLPDASGHHGSGGAATCVRPPGAGRGPALPFWIPP